MNVLDLSKYNPWARLGESLGGGVSTGIAKGIDLLAKNKMEQIQLQNQVSAKRMLQREKFAEQEKLNQSTYNREQSGKGASNEILNRELAGLPQDNYQQPDQYQNQGSQDEFRRNEMENRLGGMQGSPQGIGQPNQFQQKVPSRPKLNYVPAPMSKPIPQGLNPEDLKVLLKDRKDKQQIINNKNKPVTDALTKSIGIADEVLPYLKRMKKLLDTGKVSENVLYKPRYWQNKETKDFDSLGDEVAAIAAKGEGVQSIGKIRFNKESKPNIYQDTETQYDRLNDYIMKFKKIKAKGKAYDEILAENNNNEPAGIGSLIRARLKENEKAAELGKYEDRGTAQKAVPNNGPSNPSQPLIASPATGIEPNVELIRSLEEQQGIPEYDTSNESPADRALRVFAGVASDLGAQALTLLYAPAEFGLGIANWLTKNPKASAENLTNIQNEMLAEIDASRKEGRTPDYNKLEKLTWDAAQVSALGEIPTWEDLREKGIPLPPGYGKITEYIAKATGGYTEPQGKAEEVLRGVIRTFAALRSGDFGGIYKKVLGGLLGTEKASKAINAIIPTARTESLKATAVKSLGSNVVKQGLKAAGASPMVQAVGELATLLYFDTQLGQDRGKEARESHYDNARESVGNVKRIRTFIRNKRLIEPSIYEDIAEERHMIRDIRQSVEDFNNPARNKMLEFIDENERVLENITGHKYEPRNATKAAHHVPKPGTNKVLVDELLELKRNNNKWFQLTMDEAFTGQKHFPKFAREVIHDVQGQIKNALDRYGKRNPEFAKNFTLAEDLHKALTDVSTINKFIEENASTTIGFKTSYGKAMSMGALFTGVGALDNLRNTIMNHPELSKVYWNALTAAAHDNLPAFLEAANRLDRAGQEHEKKKKRIEALKSPQKK